MDSENQENSPEEPVPGKDPPDPERGEELPSLNDDLLEALQAAEEGAGSPLLDDTPLSANPLEDDTVLGHAEEQETTPELPAQSEDASLAPRAESAATPDDAARQQELPVSEASETAAYEPLSVDELEAMVAALGAGDTADSPAGAQNSETEEAGAEREDDAEPVSSGEPETSHLGTEEDVPPPETAPEPAAMEAPDDFSEEDLAWLLNGDDEAEQPEEELKEEAGQDKVSGDTEEAVAEAEPLETPGTEAASPGQPTPATPGMDVEDLSEADIDALVARLDESGLANGETAAQEQLSDEDLSTLDNAVEKEPAQPAPDEDDLSAAEIGELVSRLETDAPAEPSGTATGEEAEPLSETPDSAEEPESAESGTEQLELGEEDIEALVAGLEQAAGEVASPEGSEEQTPPPTNGSLEKEDLGSERKQAEAPGPADQEPQESGTDMPGEASGATESGVDQETQAEGTPEGEEEAALSQDDLDALIAQQAQPGGEEKLEAQTEQAPHEEPEGEEEAALSQDDLDALIAQQTQPGGEETQAAQPEQTPEEESQDKEEDALSQDDLDALIAQQAQPGEEETQQTQQEQTPEEDSEDEGILSQDDLDALIAQQGQQPDTPPQEAPLQQPPQAQMEDEDGLSQEDLDALIAQQTQQGGEQPEQVQPEEAPSEAGEDEAALSQDDLDAMIAQQTQEAKEELSDSAPEAPPPADESAEADAVLSQDLDKLISEETGSDAKTPESAPEPARASEEPEGELDQSELDALIAGLQHESGADQPAAAQSEEVSQSDIDALLTNAKEDDVLAGGDPDAPVTQERPAEAPAEAAASEGPIDQSSIDALMASLGGEGDEGGESESVSQDMINELIASAGEDTEPPVEPSGEKVGSENLAAAATAQQDPNLLSQDDLDAVIALAKQQDKERGKNKERLLDRAIREAQERQAAQPPEVEEAPAPAPQPKPKKPRKPSKLGLYIYHNLPRVAAAIAAGVLTSALTFTTLFYNQEHVPDMTAVTSGAIQDLRSAMDHAQALMDEGQHNRAAQVLEKPIEAAPPSPERADARFMQAEAQYRGFSYVPGDPSYTSLHTALAEVVDAHPTHPRAAEALYWKAKLYELDEVPYAAHDTYKHIFDTYGDAPYLDTILLDAAKLAIGLRDPRSAAEYTQRLLQQFPGSALVGDARLVLGDAYAMAGMEDDARTIYVRTAQSAPDTSTAAEAYLRLGRLAFEQGRYTEAVRELETRLNTTATLEGNDEVFLLLARAHRRLGNLEEAREKLRELVEFLPESEATPEALVELTQVMDAMGRRKEAVLMAQRAAARFPDNPAVLRNKGEMLGLSGNPFGAASAMVAAEEAGARDPALLLTAARHFRTAGLFNEAMNTYRKLKRRYPGSAQAIEGGVEHAQLLHQDGQVERAAEELRGLVAASRGTPQAPDALTALARLYEDLGLPGEAADLYLEAADTTQEPETRTDAALALLEAERTEEARKLAQAIDLNRVPDQKAYLLHNNLGRALLQVDPRRGLDQLEQAHLQYPEQRRPGDEQFLLETYLDAGQTAAARRMVMEKVARAREDASEIPHAVDAAITWGDHVYEREDYRTAADAYGMAVEAANRAVRPLTTTKHDPRWAKYQRANALLELADFRGSLPLFQEISASDVPWAEEAAMKAEYAQLEQRLRGGPRGA